MFKKTLIVAALASSFAMPAFAADAPPVTYNVSLVSDYLYRGISQTGTGPAIQGGLDYAHASGFYAGAWASTITWLKDANVASSAPIEIDTYAGYKGAMDAVSYDVGFLRYNYPGTYNAGMVKADTNEIYGAVTYNIVTAKLSYSLGDLFGVADAGGSTYFELNASYPLADTGVTLGGHYGMQSYSGTTVDTAATYADFKLSATKDFSGFGVTAALSSTDAGAFYTNPAGDELGATTVVLSVTRAF